MTDFRVKLQSLINEAENWVACQLRPPANDELVDLAFELRSTAASLQGGCGWTKSCAAMERVADLLDAGIISCFVVPPTSVSERLPGPGDCDAEGQVWQWDGPSESWVLYTSNGMSIRHAQGLVDHWLPAHALPLPSREDRP